MSSKSFSQQKPYPCGFVINSKTDESIPLRSQNVYLKVINQVACYEIRQSYLNDEKDPIEALFTFPTPACASVYSFEAKNDEGTVIVCEVKEKTKAKEEYNDAISKGDTSYYMQQESGDVFSVAIGNLPPKHGVEICIKYVLELMNEENHKKLRIMFPLTIMPRYTPCKLYGSYQGFREHRSVNPPKVDKKPFSMSIEGDIIAADGIVGLDSKTHKIKLSKMSEVSLHFEISNIDNIDADIVLTLERSNSKSHALTQEFKGELKNNLYKYCTAINVVPDFSRLPPVNVNDVHYVIVLDKSGSMDGSDIEICKTAAQNFVGLLPNGCTFDVYTFNDEFDKLSGDFSDTISKKLAASKWIDNIESNGGTEILPVLQEIYSSLKKIEKTGVIVILSDGGISNTEDVLCLVKENTNVSVFSIGIGNNVSKDLIQGLASQGNGHAEFIGSGDKIGITGKVRSQLKKSQDTLRKSQNKCSLEVESEGKRLMIPEKLPTFYDKTNNVIFLFTESKPISIKFTEHLSEIFSDTRTLVPEYIKNDSSCAMHRIAAIRLLNHLQHKGHLSKGSLIDDLKTNKTNRNDHKDEIIQVSTDLNVLSKYTAFIGVEKRVEKVSGEMKLREVPLQTPDKYRAIVTRGCGRGRGAVGATGSKGVLSMNYSASGRIFSGLPSTSTSKSTSSFLSFGGGEMPCGGFAMSRNVQDAFVATDYSDREEMCESAEDYSKKVKRQSVFGMAKNLFDSVKTKMKDSLFSDKVDNEVDIDNDIDMKIDDEESKSNTKAKVPDKEVKYTVRVSLSGKYIRLKDVLSATMNEYLVDTLLKLLCDLTGVNLKVGDIIKLTKETDKSLNTYVEIISLGSDNEPWTLSIVAN